MKRFFIISIVVILIKAKLKKVKKKKKRGEGESLDEGRPYVTKIFAKFSHDAPLPTVKKKHLTIEQLNARRRKVWLTIAKKEIPKVSIPKAVEELLEIPAALSLRNVDSDLLQSLVLLILFISILQSFKQKTSAKNLVLTNAKKVNAAALLELHHL